MKPTSCIFGSLLFPVFWLGTGFLPLAAQRGVSDDPFAVPNPSEVDSSAGVDPFEVTDRADIEPEAPELVQVQVEFIELPHKALSKLLFLADPKPTDGTAFRKKLQEMVEKDEAEVVETQVIVCGSGQKASNESIHEFIYPTEYEPPSFPDHSIGRSPLERSSVVLGETGIPTAFETRNLGCTLEVEPTIGDEGKFVDLQLVPEFGWHTGNTNYLEKKDTLGNVTKLEMPDIYSIQLNTKVTCAVGQYLVVSVLSPKDAKGEVDMSRKVIVFVKCDVLAVE